jgi:hypothetical protein
MTTRKNRFILKRSNVVDKIPSLSDLKLGELALNTADVKAYAAYTGGATGATEVREIGWNRLALTGGTITGDLTVNTQVISPLFSGTTFSGGTFFGDGSNLVLGSIDQHTDVDTTTTTPTTGDTLSWDGTNWVPDSGFTYISDYFVSDDIGDDTNNGLSEHSAFKTLDAALDAVTSGGVSAAIHILDDSTYTVTETTGTPGVRTTAVELRLFAPVAKIVGQAGGVDWRLDESKFYGSEVDGTLLAFRPLTTQKTHQHTWLRITDQNLLYKSIGGDPIKSRWQINARYIFGDGLFCDFAVETKFFLKVNDFGITGISTANDEGIFRSDANNSIIHVDCQNIDGTNSGAGTLHVVYVDNGALGWIKGQCSATDSGGYADGGSKIFSSLSAVSGGPKPYTNGGTGEIHAQSKGEGFDFQWLNATGGLSLTDIINIHDIGTGEQVKATLTELQSLINTDTDIYTTGATFNSGTNILSFNRTDTSNAYTTDLSSLVFTGNTSGTCITDFYVTNIHGCSPINMKDETIFDSTVDIASTLTVSGSSVFNEGGGDFDFRVEGDTEENLLFVDASTDRIGIGTNAPNVDLDVRGAVTFNEDGDSVDFRVESDTKTHILFVDGSADRIGINTSSPSNLFHIVGKGSTTSTSGLRVYNSANNLTFRVRDDEMVFINAGSGAGDNNTTALSVHENSNYTVSATNDNFHIALQTKSGAGHLHHKIGVMHPQGGLTSKTGGDLSVEAGSVRNDATGNVDAGDLYLRSGRASTSGAGSHGTGNIFLQTTTSSGNSQRGTWATAITIDNSQNVGLGVVSAAEVLDVNGNARFRSIGSGSSAGALHYTSNGTLTTSTSDERLKENISTIKDPLKKVKKLRGVNYEWKDDKAQGTKSGFIAQEVAEVIPEATFTNPVDITYLKREITKLKNKTK